MSILAIDPLHGEQYADLYDPAMPKTKTLGVEALRKVLGPEIEASAKDGTHIITSKRGVNLVAVVPMDWYRKAREATGEPTDL